MTAATKALACRGCQQRLPEAFLDLGVSPLANSYVSPDSAGKPDPVFPLAVAYCPSCHLVQLTETVDPAQLFSDYLYFSSYSDTLLAHARAMVDELSARFDLGPGSRVVEVASNDGYLLQYFGNRSVRVLGIEPARNIAAEAQRRGIPTWNEFFSSAIVPRMRSEFGLADVIIGNNVLAHVPAINDFLAAVRACLTEEGVAIFEFPYLDELLKKIEFDTIYHEHVFYYSLTAIDNLARRAGLSLFDVSHQPVHGGSLRVFLQAGQKHKTTPLLARLFESELVSGLLGRVRYDRFSDDVRTLKTRLVEYLQSLKADGQCLAAYGAPAKGNTLLNVCGIGCDLLEFTVDRSPHKQGLLLPGSRIPILHPDELMRRRPDVTLILPWNIAKEIVEQQGEYVRAGGRFLVPVPYPAEVVA